MSISPSIAAPLLSSAISALGVRVKAGPSTPSGALRLRIGGKDARNEEFLGWIEVEAFTYHGDEGSFCVMQKERGNPISWRQLWKALIGAEGVRDYVLKKRN
jgi:serine/threonine-protein kinase CHEK1